VERQIDCCGQHGQGQASITAWSCRRFDDGGSKEHGVHHDAATPATWRGLCWCTWKANGLFGLKILCGGEAAGRRKFGGRVWREQGGISVENLLWTHGTTIWSAWWDR